MKKRKYKTDYPRWYGIYGIRFISHGEWSDPEIKYHGYLINIHCVEDSMWELYRSEGFDDSDSDTVAFGKWMYDNRELVREECQYVIDNRADFAPWVQFVGY